MNEKYGSEKRVRDVTYGGLAKSAIFEIQNLSIGKTAPDIIGEDTEGVPLKLNDYRGKVVMLSFWGAWCGPCMHIVPHEREIVERLKDEPFALMAGDSLVRCCKCNRETKERCKWFAIIRHFFFGHGKSLRNLCAAPLRIAGR